MIQYVGLQRMRESVNQKQQQKIATKIATTVARAIFLAKKIGDFVAAAVAVCVCRFFMSRSVSCSCRQWLWGRDRSINERHSSVLCYSDAITLVVVYHGYQLVSLISDFIICRTTSKLSTKFFIRYQDNNLNLRLYNLQNYPQNSS